PRGWRSSDSRASPAPRAGPPSPTRRLLRRLLRPKSPGDFPETRMTATAPLKLLIVEARFYDDLSDALLDGAKAALDAAGARYDVVTVPGALEVPAAITFALDAAEEGGVDYDGFVALGCVIRGE